MRFHLLPLLACLTTTALANVKFTAPAAGASFAAGVAFTITWTDDGKTPTIDQFKTYTLDVMYGGDTVGTSNILVNVGSGTYSGTTGSVSANIGAALGASSTKGYFLRMTSIGVDGGADTIYSSRFGLTGMTGTFTNAAAAQAISTVTALTDVPTEVNGLVATAAATTGAVALGDEPWTVAYHLQTGLIKYAPPQPIPGTKITAKSASMMNPSTSYTIFTTYAKPATITYTATASQTSSVSSRENTVAAASQPTGDMKKYLNRWKD